MDNDVIILAVVFFGFLIVVLYSGLKSKKTEEEVVEKPLRSVEVIEKPQRRVRNIIEIEGIGPKYAERLNAIEIKTTDDLLEAGSTPKERNDLAEKTGISPKLILEWVNIADLFRIEGVGEEYSDLLEEAGVDTVIELSRRNPENLHTKIVEINEEKNLVRRVPSLEQVKEWINQAKNLPRKVEYS